VKKADVVFRSLLLVNRKVLKGVYSSCLASFGWNRSM
jgi:hypothetical protein